MLEYVQDAIRLNHHYATALLEGVSDEQWVAPDAQPAHPASIVAHLAACYEMVRVQMGGEAVLPAEWGEQFAPGAAATADAAYPSPQELVAALDDQRSRMQAMLVNASAEELAVPTEEPFRSVIPTIGAMLVLMLTNHEAVHLGQLSAWRRATGMELPY
jgi:uncharacterized damage-inducible protein DinB